VRDLLSLDIRGGGAGAGGGDGGEGDQQSKFKKFIYHLVRMEIDKH
jgi:hypothetical protein